MPTKDQAWQFALMIQAGLPSSEAITYFTDSTDPQELGIMLRRWMSSKLVRDASATLMGKSWQEMTLEEKIKTSLDYHYAGLAYFLLSHNYSEVGDKDKAKADAARHALESKLAGTAGKTDALSQFFNDINTGKVKLGKAPVPAAN